MSSNSFDNLKKKNILFISELPENVNKSELENFFADYKSDIFSMQIDSNHKRYDNTKRATILFKEHDKAAEARNNLNMKKLKGKALNIMWHETDNSVRYNNKANLFVKGIHNNAQPRQIYELFAKFGEIISCKICENEDGDLLGYGYINYYNLDSANNAIQNLNNTKFLDSNLEVEHFQRKNERLQAPEENSSLYIKNIPEKYIKTEELKKLFSKFGTITFSKMFKDDNNRHYAIIIFSEAGNARKAKEELNNKKLSESDELPLYVDLLQKKSERKRIIANKITENNNKLNEENKNCNLYVKNLPRELTEEKMKEIFSKVGEVKSVKKDKYILQTKVNGKDVEYVESRGFGYVCYTNEEDAKKAIEEFNEKKLPGFENCQIPVLVSIFMPKNERKKYLSKKQEQENNFSINQPQIPYPMLYPMQPRPVQNRFANNYKKPKYPPQHIQQNQIVNQQNLNQGSTEENKQINNNSSDEPSLEKLKSLNEEEQKDYLGEFLFKKIEQHPIAQSHNLDVETISRITGMILGIENIDEIYGITINYDNITARIKEGLELLGIQ